MEKQTENFNYSLEDKFLMEDVECRHLYINEMIDEENSVSYAVYHILRYNREDKDNNISIEDRKPIIIYINTPGGIVTDGYAIIDAILTSQTPVYTVNLGIAYSMGFLVYIAGHKRYSMKNATFLCHDGSTAAWDSMNKVKDRIEFETEQMEEHTMNYIVERTNITAKKYVANKRREWYFYPKEAKELGVVDYIIGEDCTLDEII